MKLLYISALSSQRLISEIYEKTQANPGFAVQKFSRLLVQGLVRNQVEVSALSVPPITRQYTSKFLFKEGVEIEGGVRYRYIPLLNLPLLKHIYMFLYSFFYVLLWGIKEKNNKAIICDVLCVSTSIGSLLASKLCGLCSVAVVTDIYEQMVGEETHGVKSVIKKLAGYLNKRYVGSFSKYVLLTNAMNELVNPKGRPYIVMEGLCDESLADRDFTPKAKSYPKVIMYAGGLEERYGLKMLVDAFKMIPDKDVELHLYGNGSYVDELIVETQRDQRIKFMGVKSNAEIVEAEDRATLLVNPRFASEEFTKYSFPSKNMEYMVSGTPLLTTCLPGMPEEYYPFVYLIEKENVEGYAQAISDVMVKSDDSLVAKGLSARAFVLRFKNNIFQSGRIVEFIKGDA